MHTACGKSAKSGRDVRGPRASASPSASRHSIKGAHMTKATLIGSPVSPFVRKVMVVAHLKGIAVEIDPLVAFFADDAFEKISPLRRIPVWRDDRVTLADSSVICQYLEDRYPTPAVYPADIAERAEARFLEEFA